MTSIKESIRRLFEPVKPLPAGTYPYQAPPEAEFPYRLHLRLEPDGSGILIVNASTVLHLNQTAAELAYYLVKGVSKEQAAANISSRYRVSRAQALQDYRDLVDRIKTMVNTPDLDPEEYLEFERNTPYTHKLSAPYRLDCALTYQVSPGTPVDDAPVDRVTHELSTEEWKTILDKAWDVGIPHVIFTGGEPTLREDLLTLLAYCEQKGMVTGLLSDGLKMEDAQYLNDLLQPEVGLDHLMLILQPENERAWAALQNLLAADLFVTVHLTLTPENVTQMPGWIERLAEMGVKALSLSASSPDLKEPLQTLRNLAAQRSLSLVWDLPVPYSASHPIAMELANHAEPVEGAGKAWLYVEPDGDVLPAQGVNQVLGNFLTDPWEKIWKQ